MRLGNWPFDSYKTEELSTDVFIGSGDDRKKLPAHVEVTGSLDGWDAGFIRVNADGRYAKWRHSSGVWVPVPESHRMISAGVVRKIDKAIEESEGK